MDTSPLLLKLQQMLEMYALKASPEYLARLRRLVFALNAESVAEGTTKS